MQYKIDIDPANADADGIAADLPTGTDWATGVDAEWVATSAGDGLAHQLVVTTAGNEPAGNAPTLTITGTDADDKPITDSVVLPNATTIETAKYFKTVTSATTGSDATVGVVDIGWVDEVATPTQWLNWEEGGPIQFYVDVTGTISIDVQFTNADVRNRQLYPEQSSFPWFVAAAGLDDETADVYTRVTGGGLTGFRVVVNSYTDTAEAQVYASQGKVG